MNLFPAFFTRLLRKGVPASDSWEEILAALQAPNPSTARTDLLARLELQMSEIPSAVGPSLAWLESSAGTSAAEASAHRVARNPAVTAGSLTELAHFRYGKEQWGLGDELLERAKRLSPDLPRIFEEEAWNQRQRSNVHREIQAVERRIALATSAAETLDWEIWLGEALLRRHDPESAWIYLSRFPELPAADNRVFSAASCARLLGLADQALAALSQAAPGPHGDIEAEHAAEVYLAEFQSPMDAEWALTLIDGPLGDNSSTRALELGAQIALRSGAVDAALYRISMAAERHDHGVWVPGFHAMLLELLDRPREALDVYERHGPASPLELFRAGVLIQEQRSVQEAVEWTLPRTKFLPRSWRSLVGGEVDPSLVRKLNSSVEAASGSWSTAELSTAVLSASSTALRAQAAWELAQREAASGHWQQAWSAIVAAQDLRLPALPFTQLDRLTSPVTPEIRYAEFSVSEPVNPKIVLYESDLGETTLGDPLALCLALLADSRDQHLTHIWSITSGAVPHPTLVENSQVVFVRKGSPGYFRALATAGLLITNTTHPTEFTKRDGQKSVICWKGTDWQRVGRYESTVPTRHGNITRNFLHADLVFCPDASTWKTLPIAMDVDELNPAAFQIMEPPRRDLARTLSASRSDTIASELSLPSGEPIILYAPYFEGTELTRQGDLALASASVLAHTGSAVVIAGPPRFEREVSTRTLPEGVTLRRPNHDMNELLGMAYVVVSEGAAAIADAIAADVPSVALTDSAAVPGKRASNASQAREVAESLRETGGSLSSHHQLAETLHESASTRALSLIFQDTHEPSESDPGVTRTRAKHTLLISTDGFPENGITQSLRSLLSQLKDTECSVYLRPWPSALRQASDELQNELFTRSRLLIGVGQPAGTRMEREALRFFTSPHYVDSEFVRSWVVAERAREGRRRYGSARFDGVLEFTGYLSSSLAMSAVGVPTSGKRGVVFHNEMWQEILHKYPQLRAGMHMLSGFDFIGSVSDGVRDANAAALGEHFGVPQEHHLTIENTLDPARIQSLARQPLTREAREWLEQPGRHACVIARLSPEKNHEQLLQVLAAHRGALREPVRLSLLGDGPLRADLERLSQDLGLTDLVRFFGQVPAPQAHLTASAALLLPSLHEGQPLVILEALTVGTPVVATDTPGSRSALADGRYGTLVPVNDNGIRLALDIISAGPPEPEQAFDPALFTENSVNQLFAALGFPQKPSRSYRRQD